MKQKLDTRTILNCFSVAAITALSLWHGFHFYIDRISQPAPTTEIGKLELIPITSTTAPAINQTQAAPANKGNTP